MEGTYIPRFQPDKRYKLTLSQLSDLHYGEVVLLDGPKNSYKDDLIFQWCHEQNISASWAGRFYAGHKERKDVWIVQNEAKRLMFALRWA